MKTRFNVELYNGYNDCCLVAVKTAAIINSGDYPEFTMQQIVTMAKHNKEVWPNLSPDTTIELVDETLLNIDAKVNGKWKTVCRIEMVEITALKTADDILNVSDN